MNKQNHVRTQLVKTPSKITESTDGLTGEVGWNIYESEEVLRDVAWECEPRRGGDSEMLKYWRDMAQGTRTKWYVCAWWWSVFEVGAIILAGIFRWVWRQWARTLVRVRKVRVRRVGTQLGVVRGGRPADSSVSSVMDWKKEREYCRVFYDRYREK